MIDKLILEKNNKALINLVFDIKDPNDIYKIADYLIKDNDYFNICELINISDEIINTDIIVDKIIETNNEEFIFYVYKNSSLTNLSLQSIEKLKKFLYK